MAPGSGSGGPKGNVRQVLAVQEKTVAFICPQSAVDKLEKEKMPRKGGRWWFSWRRRDFPAEEVGSHGHRAGAAQEEVKFTRRMFLP